MRNKLKDKVRKYEKVLTGWKKIERSVNILKKPIDDAVDSSGITDEKDIPVYPDIMDIIGKIKECKYDEKELLSCGESIIKKGLAEAQCEFSEKGPLYIKLGILGGALFTVLVL